MLKVTDRRVPPGLLTYVNTDNGVTVYTGTLPISESRVLGTYKSISGTWDGGFTPGVLRINPVTIQHGFGSVTTGRIATSHISFPNSSYVSEGQWGVAFGDMPFGTRDANEADFAKIRALSKLSNPEIGLGVMAGELAETLKTLRNPLNALESFLKPMWRRYRSGNATMRKNFPRFVDFLANQWLEINYGIIPIIKDVEAVMKALDKQFEFDSNRLRRAKSKRETTDSSTTTVTSGDGRIRYSVVKVTTTKRKTVCGVYYNQVLESRMRRRGKLLGTDITNIPQTAWNLIPSSFLVDWVFDIGSYLSAMMPKSHLQFRGCYVSQVIKVSYTSTPCNPTPMSGYKLNGFVPSEYRWDSETLIRTVESPTVPVLPAYNPDALDDVKRVITSLALTWQRINGLFKRRA